MSIQIACSTLSLSSKTYPDLDDTLNRIKDLGFEYVDLAVFEGWQNIDPSWLARASENEMDALVERILSTGLSICALNAGTSKRIPDADEDSRKIMLNEHQALIRFAEKLSCPIITIQPCNLKQHTLEEAISLTRSIAPRLEALHSGSPVKLTFETHKNTALEDPKKTLDLIKSLEPEMKITYDNSHYTMQDIHLQDTKPLLEHAHHIHVRTSAPGNMQAPYPNGCEDIGELAEELKKRDYQGAIAIEYFNGFDDDLVNLKQLKTFLEERLV